MNGSAAVTVPDTVALLLADKRSAETRRAYAADINRFFAATLGTEATPDAVRQFVGLPAPEVALRLAEYKAGMVAAGLAEATTNRRLASVRALLCFAYRLGLGVCDGRGLVSGEKVVKYRETRGVGGEALRRLVAAPDTGTLRGLRDAALLRTMAELALRRAEICALDVSDFDRDGLRLQVLGKGRGTQRAPMTVSPRCVDAICAYLAAAGHGNNPNAPLFRSLDRRPGFKGRRLHPNGLRHVVQARARDAGLGALAPHQVRHSAITLALDATKGDVRRVQRLSRHADVRTLMLYDDARADFQGEVTNLVSDLL